MIILYVCWVSHIELVSTCQVIGWKDPFEDFMVRRLPPQSPGGRECLCVFFFCCACHNVPMYSPTPYRIYISYTYDTI